jgi:toxin ParE1/3/4
MALKLVIARQAKRDLEGLLSYIAAEDKRAAGDMQARFDKTLRLLTEKPFMGPAVPGLGDEALRKFTVSPYIIFYRSESRKIQIVRILHSSMDLARPDALDRKG